MCVKGHESKEETRQFFEYAAHQLENFIYKYGTSITWQFECRKIKVLCCLTNRETHILEGLKLVFILWNLFPQMYMARTDVQSAGIFHISLDCHWAVLHF